MGGFTAITVMGNLGKDPEVKFMADKKAVANFSIAVSEGKDKPATWFRCAAFGKTAELIGQHFTKGNPILVNGRIECRKYEKDGVQKESWDVNVERFSFVDRKAESSGGGGSQIRDDGFGPPPSGGNGGPSEADVAF